MAPKKPVAKPAAKKAKAPAAAKPAAKPAKAAKPAAKAGKAAAKPVAKAGAKGKAVPAKAEVKKQAPKKKGPKKVALFEKLFRPKAKDWGIGNAFIPNRDVTRFVRWPKYVLAQRQKRVLQKRLKIPPSLNQFNRSLDTHTKNEITKLASKYQPETKAARKERLRKEAAAVTEARKAGKKAPAGGSSRPSLKCGLQLVTRMVEKKKAKLVLIAHDVDPVEVIIWLPALCRQMEVPYCIVKGKSVLGKMAGLKTASCLAFTNIKNEDQAQFKSIVEASLSCFNNKEEEIRRQWGGLELGRRTVEQQKKKARARAAAK